jgi:acetyl esterase/lipase
MTFLCTLYLATLADPSIIPYALFPTPWLSLFPTLRFSHTMYRMTTRVTSLFTAIVSATLLVATAHAQQTVLPLWPHGAPEPPMTSDAEVDVTKPTDGLFNGKRSQRLTNVSKPTLTVYSPVPSKDAHVAALVFPGGGYVRLAWNGEGTDTCDWLTSIAAPDVPTVNGTPRDARPNFAIVAYPAYLTDDPTEKELNPVYTPNKFTPPTFVFQAENDKTYGRNAIVYYRALMDAHIPAELHYFASGGHGFGVHPTGTPAEHWTRIAAFWMHTTGILPSENTKPSPISSSPNAPTSTGGSPCTLESLPTTNTTPAGGNPAKPSSVNNHTSDPTNPCPQ